VNLDVISRLTPRDIENLDCIARDADMVGLSFVQSTSDFDLLRVHLHQLDRDNMGIVLKIGTLQGFDKLLELMLAAMAGSLSGTMITRGNLAVEYGYERLSEVQEKI
jgi:pyruvate kinase